MRNRGGKKLSTNILLEKKRNMSNRALQYKKSKVEDRDVLALVQRLQLLHHQYRQSHQQLQYLKQQNHYLNKQQSIEFMDINNDKVILYILQFYNKLFENIESQIDENDNSEQKIIKRALQIMKVLSKANVVVGEKSINQLSNSRKRQNQINIINYR